jgi:hypothetical protein
MSTDFMRGLAAPPDEITPIAEHVIWRLVKNGRFAEARMRIVPIGNGRPELRIYVQHPTPEFQLLTSQLLKTGEELDTLARQQRQLFEAKGWTVEAR